MRTTKKIIISSEKPLMSEPPLVPPEARPPRRKMPDTICEYNRCDWERAHRLLDEASEKMKSQPEDEWEHKLPPYILP